jgi:hypothetical protein
MKPTGPALAQLQAWMQTVVTHHAGVAQAVASEAAAMALGDAQAAELIVLPSRAQSSLERLAVYGNAYYARLLHCLQELFPVSCAAVGEEIFQQFAFAYLQQHPPTSYTLGGLASRFVDFLDQSRREHFLSTDEPDADTSEQGDGPNWARFLVELAQLEFTIDDVFDGPGIERDPPSIEQQLASVSPEKWPSLCLRPAPCLRLLAFEFPVNRYFSAYRRNESPEIPELESSYLAITRRNYVVRRLPLDPIEYVLLTALVGGETVASTIDCAIRDADRAIDWPNYLSARFQRWAVEQMFIGIHFD